MAARMEMSQHQQPVVHCGEDPGVPECTVQQWVVVGKTNSRVSYYQTDCSGGQATRDIGGGIMVARVVALELDVQLIVTRRR